MKINNVTSTVAKPAFLTHAGIKMILLFITREICAVCPHMFQIKLHISVFLALRWGKIHIMRYEPRLKPLFGELRGVFHKHWHVRCGKLMHLKTQALRKWFPMLEWNLGFVLQKNWKLSEFWESKQSCHTTNSCSLGSPYMLCVCGALRNAYQFIHAACSGKTFKTRLYKFKSTQKSQKTRNARILIRKVNNVSSFLQIINCNLVFLVMKMKFWNENDHICKLTSLETVELFTPDKMPMVF